ncbi:MAG: HU family DNA-binding protein [Oligoflexia bacterium]|nr:HU family DNA-binding protein [Oligoflexia bacterium]
MNRKELVDEILKQKGLDHLSKREADHFISSLLETIKKTVKKGDSVSLIGFGTFSKVRRAARDGHNPSTGEKMRIKARTVPKFKAGQAFKESVI